MSDSLQDRRAEILDAGALALQSRQTSLHSLLSLMPEGEHADEVVFPARAHALEGLLQAQLPGLAFLRARRGQCRRLLFRAEGLHLLRGALERDLLGFLWLLSHAP